MRKEKSFSGECKMDVLLVLPPWQAITFGAIPPFGLMYIAAFLRDRGYSVSILDCDAEGVDFEKLPSVLLDKKPKVVGVASFTDSRFNVIKSIKLIRKVLPRSLIVGGGPHFTHCAEDALEKISELDVVVRGEGEYTMPDIMKSLDNREDFDHVWGISWRDDNGEIITNPDRPPIQDLDSLPRLDYGLLNGNYSEKLLVIKEDIPSVSVLTSRGCPNRCVFCCMGNTAYRRRDPGAVLDEVEELMTKRGVNAVKFIDSTLTTSKDHVEALCEGIINRKLKFKWWCECRVNIDLSLLELMKEAGLVATSFGVESGSPEILKTIQKGITVEQARAFAQKCHSLGIQTQVFFMISHPEETLEDFKMTQNLMAELQPLCNIVTRTPSIIYPGTKLEALARESGLLSPNFSWNEPYYSKTSKELVSDPVRPVFLDKIPVHTLQRIMLQESAKGFISQNSPTQFLSLAFKKMFRGDLNMRTLKSGISILKAYFK